MIIDAHPIETDFDPLSVVEIDIVSDGLLQLCCDLPFLPVEHFVLHPSEKALTRRVIRTAALLRTGFL